MAWQKTNRQDLADAAEKILPAALAYLAKREYSTCELRKKLLGRGADKEQTEQVLYTLQEKGYLSDLRFAEAFVRDKREFHPCGEQKIRFALREKGIAADIISEALENEYDEQRQRAALAALLRSAAAKAPEEDIEQRRKYRDKAIRRMLAKGFSQSLILSEIEENFPVKS